MVPTKTRSPLIRLQDETEGCSACPRLRKHCLEIAKIKRRSFQEEPYWGKPIVGFGDPKAQLLIVGLAPAAHGANRTGRVFTGDRSGEWLYRALHRAGFANQAESVNRNDGLALKNSYVTCVVKCAPPDNKPLPNEIENCSSYFERELQALPNVKAYLALGQIALNGLWPWIAPSAFRKPKFGHGLSTELPNDRKLFLSYHPSQQNTFTGRLTEPMFDSVFNSVRNFLTDSKPGVD